MLVTLAWWAAPASAADTRNGTELYVGPGGSQATDGSGIYGTLLYDGGRYFTTAGGRRSLDSEPLSLVRFTASMNDRLNLLSLRLVAIAIGLVLLVSGLVGFPYAVRALRASIAVRLWPERACVVEDLKVVEVPSWFPAMGSGHYELRLLLRDVETGRQWRNADVSRPPPQAFEVSALSQEITMFTPGAQLDCRVSPDGDTAVARSSALFVSVVQCGVALFALFCLSGGVYTLWASVQRE